MQTNISKQLNNAKKASASASLLSHSQRNLILKNLIKELDKNKKEIIKANLKDLQKLSNNDPMYDRLLLNENRINGMIEEIKNLIKMKDPLGEIFDCRERSGLKICKQRVPIGVIGIIYESRPNVTTDVASICIKSGNVAVLKGGKEARESYIILHKLIKNALRISKANTEIIQFIDPNIKDSALDMIGAIGFIDVIIPRGSSRLIKFIRENAKVPVIETGAGVCHTYVDEKALLNSSAEIIFNAKTQRPSVCNALDTLVVNKKIIKEFLPKVAKLLINKKVEIFSDKESYKILKNIYPRELLKIAKNSEFGCEFLSLKMSIKTVSNIDEAIKFINIHSSKHSEAILTENNKNAKRFLNEIDAAVVYVNASTRFSDGAVFGLGSEIGISTNKIHARGPMGPNEMTTYKWIVTGKYNIRK